jgi:uncharacterized membrane protein SirB2
MIEFYAPIKAVHVGAVLASGSLFALRGGASLAGAAWPQWATVRFASYTIDTVLLTAALMLFAMLPGAMFANGWLALKLVLLVAYIALGAFALRRARATKTRAVCYAAALAVLVTMIGVARAHHPLGWVHLLPG